MPGLAVRTKKFQREPGGHNNGASHANRLRDLKNKRRVLSHQEQIEILSSGRNPVEAQKLNELQHSTNEKLAQIEARADHHFTVKKVHEGGYSSASVKKLRNENRKLHA